MLTRLGPGVVKPRIRIRPNHSGFDLAQYTSGQPQGDAKKLVDYTLSAEGQQFVSKSGFVPLK